MSTPRPSATHVSGGAPFDVEDLPAWMDRTFPLLFIALGGISSFAIVTEATETTVWLAVALITVSVSPWALALAGVRLRDPVFAAVVVAPTGVLVVFGDSFDVQFERGASQLVMMLLLGIVGQIGTIGTARLVRNTTIVAFAVVIVGASTRGNPFDWAPWLVGITLAVGGGRAFRANAAHVMELRAAQHALAQQAVSEERRRIAREVHDIVAHTMSVTMLHLTAARLAVRRDPAAAEEALAEAERHGRSSMEDIRGVVRLLRSDESAVTAALPDDTDLPDLVERYVSAGSDVRLRVDGTMASLPPTVRLTVFRLVQESLSNAARHGRGPIVIDVSRRDEGLEIDVTNPVNGANSFTPGAGLAGMRERVEALDGTFAAGPDGTSWRVHARIPA